MVRVDARENRDRVLAVARLAFAESDDVSMNQIAQLAGVGPGTLYRNFPNREALVLAIYEDEVVQLTRTVDGLLADHAPLDALRTWTVALVQAMRKKHGLGDALSQAALQTASERSYQPVIDAITRLLDAGKHDGSIRSDAEPADFLMLTGSLWRAVDHPQARPDRMLDLVLDGLRSDGRLQGRTR
jgi:AcrR family transcriptional regulator